MYSAGDISKLVLLIPEIFDYAKRVSSLKLGFVTLVRCVARCVEFDTGLVPSCV